MVRCCVVLGLLVGDSGAAVAGGEKGIRLGDDEMQSCQRFLATMLRNLVGYMLGNLYIIAPCV